MGTAVGCCCACAASEKRVSAQQTANVRRLHAPLPSCVRAALSPRLKQVLVRRNASIFNHPPNAKHRDIEAPKSRTKLGAVIYSLVSLQLTPISWSLETNLLFQRHRRYTPSRWAIAGAPTARPASIRQVASLTFFYFAALFIECALACARVRCAFLRSRPRQLSGDASCSRR